EESLGGPVSEKFASFAEAPVAAASIAQVHLATLSSAEQVVVKVRRPAAAGLVGSDLDIVQRLAHSLQRATRWGRSVGAVDLAQGFADALREELDLRIEARNMTAVAAATVSRDDGVQVPLPYEPYCGERVLVMQFFDGRPLLSAAADRPDRRRPRGRQADPRRPPARGPVGPPVPDRPGAPGAARVPRRGVRDHGRADDRPARRPGADE